IPAEDGIRVYKVDAVHACGHPILTLTTGPEVVTLTNGFPVAAGTPVLQTVNPGSGQQGQQSLSVNLSGQFTHFVQGTTTVSFGAIGRASCRKRKSATTAAAAVNNE